MNKYRIEKYTLDLFDKWNKFVDRSNNGTIFHRLDFLDYHGDKFKDNEHHLIWFKGEAIFAVMPMAIFEENGKKIAKSPYGGSVGGIVTLDTLSYQESDIVIDLLIEYIGNISINNIYITPPISFHNTKHSDTIIFKMLEVGFKIYNSDITSVTVFNSNELNYSSSTKRYIKKAKKNKLEIVFNDTTENFWTVLEKTFEKHNVPSTHNFDELKELINKKKKKIYFDIVYFDGQPISAIGHFIETEFVDSSFYIVNNPNYNDLMASHYLFSEVLLKSKEKGYKYFNFGTATVNQKARPNIFRFKEGFGAVGFLRQTYKLSL